MADPVAQVTTLPDESTARIETSLDVKATLVGSKPAPRTSDALMKSRQGKRMARVAWGGTVKVVVADLVVVLERVEVVVAVRVKLVVLEVVLVPVLVVVVEVGQ